VFVTEKRLGELTKDGLERGYLQAKELLRNIEEVRTRFNCLTGTLGSIAVISFYELLTDPTVRPLTSALTTALTAGLAVGVHKIRNRVTGDDWIEAELNCKQFSRALEDKK
jgi:hypothetical protein